jgi:hypothetical protein
VKKLEKYWDDIFYWLGAALISAGAYLLYPIAALFVLGFFCLVFSYIVGNYLARKAQANR